MEPMQPVLVGQPWTHQYEIVIAKDQPKYLPLPALILADRNGTVITRWRLTWLERLQVLWQGQVYLQQLAFGRPLQPQLPSVEEPELTRIDGSL